MCCDQEKTQAPPAELYDWRDKQMKQAIDREREDRCNGQLGTTCAPQRPMTSEEMVAEFFKYHPPTPETLPKFAAINQAAKNFAEVVMANCPGGADRSGAINCIRMARMTANSAISLNGLSLY
jgi:hypothetical protein